MKAITIECMSNLLRGQGGYIFRSASKENKQNMDAKASDENPPAPVDAGESQSAPKQGGWITFPFLAGTMLGLGLSLSGAINNMIVYLIKEYNVKNVDAAQIYNIVNGCTSLAPVAGAIISDAFFGSFPVVAFSTFVNFLALIIFTLTATIRSLRPAPCTTTGICEPPSGLHFAVLYLAVALLSVGTGGTRFNTMSMGADQFDGSKDRETFFNWYLVMLYVSSVLGYTVIVYVQDSVSWGLGFGLCAAAAAASVVMLVAGRRFYRRRKGKGKGKAEGSPFTGLARVVVASIRKRKAETREGGGVEYYHGISGEGVLKVPTRDLTQGFRCLNRGAMISSGDTRADGSVTKKWNLCTVEQVEDLKSLLRVAPLWTSSIFLSISIGAQGSLTVLQALTMDRTVGRGFTVPASSINVASQMTVAVVLPFLDRILIPAFRNLTGRTLTPLQKLGLGHVLNTTAMAASALVERRRARVVHAHRATGEQDWIVPMSVLWLLLPVAVTGLGEAMHFPGLLSFFYQEFPESLRSTATGVVALLLAIGYYTSTAVISLVRRTTNWLPDNINASRLDNVYWMLATVGAVNFGYFVLCSALYKYNNSDSSTITTTETLGEEEAATEMNEYSN